MANKIINNGKCEISEFQGGDIFKTNDGCYYILSYVGSGYMLISLEDGGWYTSAQPSAARAVSEANGAGIKFVGRNMRITLDDPRV
jgi:hypothetical protein